MQQTTEAQRAFIIVSSRTIREGTIARRMGGLVLFRFDEGGGIQIPEGRLYATKEEALKVVKAYWAIHPPKMGRKLGRYIGNAWQPL